MNRRHGVLAVVALLSVPLAVAATAFACGSLATLKLSRSAVQAGQSVGVKGANFNSSPRSSTVTVRFNSRNGTVLWEGRPDVDGRIAAQFDAPKARPGYYVIVATQTGPDGRPAAGTPGRAPLKIKRKRRATSSSEVAAAPFAAPPGGNGPAPPAVAPVTVLAIGLGMLGVIAGGAGIVRASRRRRAVDVPRTLS
jgi:hypothetical protein